VRFVAIDKERRGGGPRIGRRRPKHSKHCSHSCFSDVASTSRALPRGGKTGQPSVGFPYICCLGQATSRTMFTRHARLTRRAIPRPCV